MKKLSTLILALALTDTLAAQPSCQSSTDAWEHMESRNIRLLNKPGMQRELEIKVADETSEMADGYKWLCPESTRDKGILFVFSRPYTGAFYMKDVFIPLDIIFFDENKRAINAESMAAVPPGSQLPIVYYRAKKPARYALEVPRGDLQASGLVLPYLKFEWLDSLYSKTGQRPDFP